MKRYIIYPAILFAATCLFSCGVTNSSQMGLGANSDVTKAVEGKVGGVMVDAASSNPELPPQFLIRGLSSINAGSAPVIVLDGMIYDGPLNGINPSDIKSVKVLKDPIDTVMYGFRGANGVVVIETKAYGNKSYSGQKKK
jgi:TonB-dependent SusC/RagA subfamily outer membrane receptor